jgi:hypothetical protein
MPRFLQARKAGLEMASQEVIPAIRSIRLDSTINIDDKNEKTHNIDEIIIRVLLIFD